MCTGKKGSGESCSEKSEKPSFNVRSPTAVSPQAQRPCRHMHPLPQFVQLFPDGLLSFLIFPEYRTAVYPSKSALHGACEFVTGGHPRLLPTSSEIGLARTDAPEKLAWTTPKPQ